MFGELSQGSRELSCKSRREVPARSMQMVLVDVHVELLPRFTRWRALWETAIVRAVLLYGCLGKCYLNESIVVPVYTFL